MAVIRGLATNVRNTVDVSGDGGHNSHVTTTHISLFLVDGKQVKVTTSQPVMINENDEVALAGETKRGVFNAYAYRNITTGANGDTGGISFILFGIGFPIAAVYFFLNFKGEKTLQELISFSIIPVLVPAIFFMAGLYILYTGIKIKSYANELDN